MNAANYIMLEELSMTNYELWYRFIRSTLKSKGLIKYVENDVTSAINNEVTAGTKTAADLEDAEKNDAKAMSFLLTTISREIQEKIKNAETSFATITKIKEIYNNKKTKDVTYYLDKLNSLRAKNLDDGLEIIDKMTEIFNTLDENNYKLGTLEKAKYIYSALTNDVKSRLTLDPDLELNDFTEEAKKIINVLRYFSGKHQEKDIKPRKIEDLMDIDYVGKLKNKLSNNDIKREPNYCYICEMKGHTTDRCGFNVKVREERRKNKSRKFKKNDNSYDWKGKRKYIGNVEVNEIKSENETNNISFEEIQPMFESHVNNVETNSNEEFNTNNKEIIWAYDTGCSEHITNNKSILTNFRYENIHMKCANNTSCEFKGIGTFIGKINNEIIRLDNVYYSEKINKNLISGVRLTENGYPCELDLVNNKTTLTLKKYNRRNNRKHVIGRYTADPSNVIKIPIKPIKHSICTITNQENHLDEYSRNLWHRRLGHFYHDNLEKYLELHNIKKPDCLTCKIAKLKRLPHKGKPPVATRILETIHSDLMGPINITSSTGKKFILTFIDEYSRKSWVIY